MDMLDHDRIWTTPMGEVATHAAIVRSVEILIRSDEQDEMLIIERVLQIVCAGRLSDALRGKLNPLAAGVATAEQPPDVHASR